MTAAIVHLMRGEIENLVGDAAALGFLPSKDEMGAKEYNEMLGDLRRVYHKAKIVSGEGGQQNDVRGPKDDFRFSQAVSSSFVVAKQKDKTRSKEIVYGAVERRREKLKGVSRELNSVFFAYPFTVPVRYDLRCMC